MMARILFLLALGGIVAAQEVPTGGSPAPSPAEQEKQEKQAAAEEALEAAQKVESDSLAQAQSKLEELKNLLPQITAEMSDKSKLQATVEKIEQDAEYSVKEQRSELLSTYESSLDKMRHMAEESPEELSSPAAKEQFANLAKEATTASKGLQNVNKQKMKAMKKTYYEMRKGGKSKAVGLWKEVKMEAHQAIKAAGKVESLGRKAGQKEDQYEGAQEKAEKVTENLSETAEKYGEKAEDKVESFYEKMENLVEHRMDAIEHQAERDAKKRIGDVKQVQQEVKEASEQLAEGSQGGQPASSQQSGSPLFLAAAPGGPEELLRKSLVLPGLALVAAMSLALIARVTSIHTPSLSDPPPLLG